MNDQNFIDFISEVFIFYGKNTTKFGLDVWIEIAKKYGENNVKSAVNAHVQNPDCGQFMPTPANIASMLSGTTKNRASLAWSKVMSVIDRCSAYNFCFDDPLIHLSIEAMGGWPAVCEWRIDEFGFKENEFSRHYETFSKMSVLPD